MTTTEDRLVEVFRSELEATRSIEAAVAAVATAVRADAGMHSRKPAPVPQPPPPPRKMVHLFHPRRPARTPRPDTLHPSVVMAVLVATAEEVGTSVPRLVDRKQRTREPEHAAARWLAAAVLRRLGAPPTEIARHVGMDLTTVLHGFKRVDASPALQVRAEALWRRLGDAEAFPQLDIHRRQATDPARAGVSEAAA